MHRLTLVVLALSTAPLPRTLHAQQRPALSAFDSAKVRALLRMRLPCLGCHTLHGEGGRIGPDLSSVSSRRSAGYIGAIIDRPQDVVRGTMMPRVPMPASTRALVTAYLSRGAVQGTPVATPAASPAAPGPATGAALYARYCAACHGARGSGDGPNAAYLSVRPAVHADAAFMATRTDDRLFDAIHGGGYPLGRSATMPAFGETLRPAEIDSLVRHLRRLCNCSGPSWGRTRGLAPAGGSR